MALDNFRSIIDVLTGMVNPYGLLSYLKFVSYARATRRHLIYISFIIFQFILCCIFYMILSGSLYILYQLNKILPPDPVFMFIQTSYKLFHNFKEKLRKQITEQSFVISTFILKIVRFKIAWSVSGYVINRPDYNVKFSIVQLHIFD